MSPDSGLLTGKVKGHVRRQDPKQESTVEGRKLVSCQRIEDHRLVNR